MPVASAMTGTHRDLHFSIVGIEVNLLPLTLHYGQTDRWMDKCNHIYMIWLITANEAMHTYVLHEVCDVVNGILNTHYGESCKLRP